MRPRRGPWASYLGRRIRSSGLLLAGVALTVFITTAAVTAGVSLSFGILDIVNIAHPAFIILGSYIAYIVNASLGLDPILVSILATPAFYLLGAALIVALIATLLLRKPDHMSSGGAH